MNQVTTEPIRVIMHPYGCKVLSPDGDTHVVPRWLANAILTMVMELEVLRAQSNVKKAC